MPCTQTSVASMCLCPEKFRSSNETREMGMLNAALSFFLDPIGCKVQLYVLQVLQDGLVLCADCLYSLTASPIIKLEKDAKDA